MSYTQTCMRADRETDRQTDGRTDEYACPRQTQVIASLQTEVTDVKLRCQCEAI